MTQERIYSGTQPRRARCCCFCILTCSLVSALAACCAKGQGRARFMSAVLYIAAMTTPLSPPLLLPSCFGLYAYSCCCCLLPSCLLCFCRSECIKERASFNAAELAPVLFLHPRSQMIHDHIFLMLSTPHIDTGLGLTVPMGCVNSRTS